MGLRSMSLAIALALASAALLVGVVWLWPALARRSAAAVSLRILMVAALQVATLGLVFVWVNRSYEFYASWSDLLGANGAVGKVVAVRGRPPATGSLAAGGRRQRTGAARSPVRLLSGPSLVRVLSSRPVAASGRGGRDQGTLQTVRIQGAVSGIVVRADVYLPRGASHPARPLPVVVMIGQLSRSGPTSPAAEAAAAAAAIASRAMPPALVAMLPAEVRGPASAGCLNVPGGPQATTFFTQDLPQALSQAYPVSALSAQWAVVGAGGGGYCALRLADDPAGEFGVAAVRSGAYTEPPGGYAPGSGKATIGVSPLLRNEENLTWRLQHLPAPPIRLLLVGAGQDRQLIASARPPMLVSAQPAAPGPLALAPVLAWLGRALGGQP